MIRAAEAQNTFLLPTRAQEGKVLAMSKIPTGYLFKTDDGGWALLYYWPRTHVVPLFHMPQKEWDVADLLTKDRKLVVKFASTDEASWGRTVMRDRKLATT